MLGLVACFALLGWFAVEAGISRHVSQITKAGIPGGLCVARWSLVCYVHIRCAFENLKILKMAMQTPWLVCVTILLIQQYMFNYVLLCSSRAASHLGLTFTNAAVDQCLVADVA